MRKHLILMTVAATLLTSCGGSKTTTAEAGKFDYTVEQFADLQILRYKVPGFEELTLKQKELIYYLTEAALEGRDILFDQNGKYNLRIRRMLEAVYTNYQGDKTTPDFKNMEVYLKRVWFSNGIHHHYGMEKFVPNFSQEFLKQAVLGLDAKLLPLEKGQTADQLCAELFPVIFDPAVMPKRVNQADGEDLVLTSACNYYDGVTQKEAERFYSDMKDPKDETPVSYGLNSRLVKENGKLTEKVWKVGGLYTQAIEKIVYWLKKAEGVAENEAQKAVITKLIQFYETGNLKDFDEYAILWVKDLDSRIDFVNGFTESYGDPLGMKASWESLVNFKDLESTHRTEIISSNAQWFEDHSPVDKSFKKEKVKGVSAKVITAAILAGDLYPATAIGINLPNANWIRAHHGSKSVTIGNITDAYNKAAHGNGFNEEFVYSDAEIQLIDAYSDLTDELHTDLHECLGHGSGKLLPGVAPDALKAYGSTIEEPPAYAVILLLTENANSLLPTICSRCVMLKLRNIKDQLVKRYLMEQLQVPDYKADVCTAFAQGNIGKAAMLAGSEHFNEIKDEAVRLLKNIDTMELGDLVEAVKRISAYKIEITDYLDILMIWYRDVLILKATEDINQLVYQDEHKYLQKKAITSSYEGLNNIMEALEKAKIRLNANVNFDITMEMLLLTIKEN